VEKGFVVHETALDRSGSRFAAGEPRQGFWALADQATVSMGNFLTQVFLARALAPEQYGVFALLFGIHLVMSGLHASLVVYPLSVRGATLDDAALRRHLAGSLLATLGLAVPLGGVMLAAAWFLSWPQLGPWAALAMLFWQVQETVRRALMAHLRHRDALPGDALSYLGQAAVVFALHQTGNLSLPTAFAAFAITSGVAAALQAAQLGLRSASLSSPEGFVADSWQLGRWILFSNILGILTIQAFPWTLALFHGPAAAAELQALINILGVTHPVMFGLSNLIVPTVAQSHRQAGLAAARRTAFRYATQGALLLAPYYAALLLAPGRILTIFYGANSHYAGLTAPLRLFVLAYVFVYAASVVLALLAGLERTRHAFFAQLGSSLASLGVGLPLAALGGIAGATGGLVLVNGVRTFVGAWMVNRVQG